MHDDCLQRARNEEPGYVGYQAYETLNVYETLWSDEVSATVAERVRRLVGAGWVAVSISIH